MNDALHIGDRFGEALELTLNHAVELIHGFIVASLVAGLSCGICGPPMLVGYARMHLRLARGDTSIQIGDVFDGFQYFLPAWILAICVGGAIFIGTLLLIIPGIVASYLLYWAFIEMADGNDDPIDCMKKSIDYNSNFIGPAIVFMIVVAILANIGHAVALGSLLTVPMAISMQAVGWVKIKDAEAGIVDVEAGSEAPPAVAAAPDPEPPGDAE